MEQLIKLTPTQQKIVDHDHGSLLVVASAGSGKTRVLTERIKRLIGRTSKKILAITFTNKAGEEMRERLGDSKEIKDQVFIGTFHGFCQHIVEMRYNLLGLSKMPQIFEDDSDRLEIVEQAIEATPSYSLIYKKYDKDKKRKYRYEVLDFISKVKRELLSEKELLKLTEDEDLVLLYHSYQEILESQNAIDFDDLIMMAYRIFTVNPSVAELYRKTYEYICIDEAQDLNNAQYNLLRALAGNQYFNIMMVGDPNQSIFAFNGSSSDYMIKNFVQDFSPQRFELQENFRSSRQVILASEKIIPGSQDSSKMAIEGIFEMALLNDENTEAEWVIQKITELISQENHDDIEGRITYEKIAILARNKYVFTNLESKLDNKKIPYYFKVTPGNIKFETKAMKVFDLGLRTKINPDDNLHLVRLRSFLKIEENFPDSEIANQILDMHIAKMFSLIDQLSDDGSNFKKQFLDYQKYIETCETIDDDDYRKMVIDEIGDLLKHWFQYSRKTEKKSLVQFKNSMALGQTHPKANPKGLTLSTVHTMKGQEYDIVFLIGMDDGTFPDYRAIKKGGIEMTQEKNNAYVAFTRARRFLFVSSPKTRLMPWGDVKRRHLSRFLKPFAKT